MPAVTNISDQISASNTVVQSQVTSNAYMVTEIHENIQHKSVHATIEFAPFTTDDDGFTSGSGTRVVCVWEGDSYDTVRDSWTNSDLIAKVTTLI